MPKDPASIANVGGSTSIFSRKDGTNAPMRGLVTFIADLRNARARELEEKRINKELANIRYVYHLIELSLHSANVRRVKCQVQRSALTIFFYQSRSQHTNAIVEGKLNSYDKKKYVCKVHNTSAPFRARY